MLEMYFWFCRITDSRRKLFSAISTFKAKTENIPWETKLWEAQWNYWYQTVTRWIIAHSRWPCTRAHARHLVLIGHAKREERGEPRHKVIFAVTILCETKMWNCPRLFVLNQEPQQNRDYTRWGYLRWCLTFPSCLPSLISHGFY